MLSGVDPADFASMVSLPTSATIPFFLNCSNSRTNVATFDGTKVH
jgi:hypothetical protein